MQKHTDEEIEKAVIEAAYEINRKQAVKAEPRHNLKDMLAGKTVSALRELAKLYEVRGYSGMAKQPLIEAVISKMSDDEKIASYLSNNLLSS